MKKVSTILTTSILSLITHFGHAQYSEIEWHRTFGGDNGEYSGRIKQTNDGGYILVGGSRSWFGEQFNNHSTTGTSDGWILKLNSVGDTTWARMFGSTWDDTFYDVIVLSDGGYLVLGRTFYGGPLNEQVSHNGDIMGYHGSVDIWVIRLDEAGSPLWSKCFGGSQYDEARSVIPTADGGFLLVANVRSSDGDIIRQPALNMDVWLLKLSDAGEIEWQRSIEKPGEDFAWCITQCNDGGYIVCGAISSSEEMQSCNNGGLDSWLLKLDTTGEIEWQKCYGGSSDDHVFSVVQTSDGGFIAVGQTNSHNDFIMNHGGTDVWVIRTDIQGNLIWRKTFGGSINEGAYSIIETANHDFMILSNTNSNDGDITSLNGLADIWLFRIDSNGQLIWQKTYGGSKVESGYSVEQTLDGGYIFSGLSNTYDDFIQAGGSDNSSHIWVVKLSASVGISEEKTKPSVILYPNPATTHITITDLERGSVISIHDITGKLMQETVVNDTQAIINTHPFASGVYMVQVRFENSIASQRLVVE